MKYLARRAKSIIVVMAMTLGVITTTAGTAHAAVWSARDGFESSPAATWGFQKVGVGSGGFEYGIGSAFEGQGNAWVSVTTGWSSILKTQRITPALNDDVSCGIQFRIQPSSAATVNIEVIDPKAWTYIALNTVNLSGFTYHLVNSGQFNLSPTYPNQPDVVVRVSLLERNGVYHWVRIDNYNMTCVY